MVTSVYEDAGINSSIKFDFLINWFSYLQDNPWEKDWDNNDPLTYIQLRADANPAVVDGKIPYLLNKLASEKRGHLSRNWV